MRQKKKNKGQPRASILVIGDEILSGRTLDSNSNYLAKKLTESGISLSEIRVVGDEERKIINVVNILRNEYDYVFTSGGIGPTHDDITAHAIAKAFNKTLEINSTAVSLLASHYPNGEADLNSARLKMCQVPKGADLIQNPISKAPGFCIENVHVMAGVPSIFKAMVDNIIPKLVGGDPLQSISVRIDRGEGDIATELSALAKKHSEISIGSYPFSQDGKYGTMIVARHTDKALLEEIEKKLEILFKS